MGRGSGARREPRLWRGGGQLLGLRQRRQWSGRPRWGLGGLGRGERGQLSDPRRGISGSVGRGGRVGGQREHGRSRRRRRRSRRRRRNGRRQRRGQSTRLEQQQQQRRQQPGERGPPGHLVLVRSLRRDKSMGQSEGWQRRRRRPRRVGRRGQRRRHLFVERWGQLQERRRRRRPTQSAPPPPPCPHGPHRRSGLTEPAQPVRPGPARPLQHRLGPNTDPAECGVGPGQRKQRQRRS